MNIMFMTKFPNGKPTGFVKKIRKCLGDIDREEVVNVIVDGHVVFTYPKFHTLRQSKRVKPGMELSLRTWAGKPYRSGQLEFAKCKCVSVQNITISKSGEVHIDGSWQTIQQSVKLAMNDGFDHADDFFEYFKDGFDGQIIHWTNLKY